MHLSVYSRYAKDCWSYIWVRISENGSKAINFGWQTEDRHVGPLQKCMLSKHCRIAPQTYNDGSNTVHETEFLAGSSQTHFCAVLVYPDLCYALSWLFDFIYLCRLQFPAQIFSEKN